MAGSAVSLGTPASPGSVGGCRAHPGLGWRAEAERAGSTEGGREQVRVQRQGGGPERRWVWAGVGLELGLGLEIGVR